MKYIYTLSDPITYEIRYIGVTNNMQIRYRQHICTTSSSKRYCKSWIISLKNKNLLPIMEELDSCEDYLSEQIEKYWISQFISWGFNLTNLTSGGEGIKGYKHTEETIKKIAKAGVGRKPKQSSIDALVSYNKSGRSKIHRKKLSNNRIGKSPVNKGIPMSIEQKEKLSKIKKGKPTTWKYIKVVQYSLDNTFVKEWDSATIAAKELNLNRANLVACLKKRRIKCGNYIWKYKI